jgi:hypothetical protein
MAEPDPRDLIAAVVATARAARERAEELIAANCAGPHRYVQHRDGREPWCPVCGYGDSGSQLRTALPGKAKP